MPKPLTTVIALMLSAAALLPASSLADRGGPTYHGPGGTVFVGGGARYGGGYYHGPRVGVYFGTPFVWGWPWGWPGYYPPAVAYPPVVATPDVVYVEKGDVEQAPGATVDDALEPGYWYYCWPRAAYYPAVTRCPAAWEKVAPIRK